MATAGIEEHEIDSGTFRQFLSYSSPRTWVSAPW
jgi:hypothetical protein